jgi:hypothetical protein
MQRCLLLTGSVLLLFAAAASAQQRPIFDPDDFVDPRQQVAPLFISRLVAGGVANAVDDYRPLHQGEGFVHLANSFYWSGLGSKLVSGFQFDYKHSETRGTKKSGPRREIMCPCQPPIFYPTAEPPGATPEAPPPSRRETLQIAAYVPRRGGPAEPPVMLRYRATLAWESVVTELSLPNSGARLPTRRGHDLSFGLDADIYFPLRGHPVFGSVVVARTMQSGTTKNRGQTEITYTSRFPAWVAGSVLVRPLVTVGGVSGRRAGGLNVVNPALEAFWHHDASNANFHLIWSPQSTRSGANGWETHHQIAAYVDRALVVWPFR